MAAFNDFDHNRTFSGFMQTIILINILKCNFGGSNKSNRQFSKAMELQHVYFAIDILGHLIPHLTCGSLYSGCKVSGVDCNSIITSLHRVSSPKLRNNNLMPWLLSSEAKIILAVSLFSRCRASSYSCSFWNVNARKSCGVKAKSKLRSKVCFISIAIKESIPISESVVPKETDLISRIPIIFITVSMMLALSELPNRFSATTMLATMASGALSNDEIRCCKVPPISISILSSTISATKPTSPTAPHSTSSSEAINNLSAKTALNLISFKKQLIPSLVSFAMSNFPISRKCPVIPKQRTEASNLSSDSEFKTKSTPLPSVSRIIIRSNEVSREFPIVGKTDSSIKSYTSGREGRSISVIRPVTTKAPDSVICGVKSELLDYVRKTKLPAITYFEIATSRGFPSIASNTTLTDSSVRPAQVIKRGISSSALAPPKPNELTPIYGFSKFVVSFTTIKRPSAKAGISDFISVKLILGAIFPVSNAKQALANEETPDAGSAWPMFDLTEPTNRAASISPLRKAVKALSKAYIELEQAVSNKNEGPSKPKLYEMRIRGTNGTNEHIKPAKQ
uniref:Uncharacterized protein n=1 Tax=Glossina palpalis gambiensis TaxID=67801 RepID=A0A1B0B9M3_9MUSC